MSDFGDWGFQGPSKRSLDLPSGPDEAVSIPGRARLRYNPTTNLVEVSVNTSPYVDVLIEGSALASQIVNDSGVAGGTVADALDVLDGMAAPVDSVFGRTGVVVAAASDYDASQVDNDSGVAGATVAAALDTLESNSVTASQHNALRQLIHFIDDGPTDGFASGSYKETSYIASNTLISNVTWYTDSGKTQKLVELAVSYSGIFPSTEVWTMYDTDGSTPLVTLTDAIVYEGTVEINRTRTYV